MRKKWILFISLSLLFAFSACSKMTVEEERKAIIEHAMKFVRAELPNPRTAVFASEKNMEIGRFKLDPHRWSVKSRVTVKGKNGQKVVYNYKIMLRYNDLFGSFSLVSSEITEMKKKKKKKKVDMGM